VPMQRVALWFAVLWAVAVGAYLLYGPIYASQTSRVGMRINGSQSQTTSVGASGMAAVEGSSAYVVVLVPVLLTAVPLVVREGLSRRVLAAVDAMLLGVLALLGAMTVGLFYFPAIVALALGAWPRPRYGLNGRGDR